MFSLVQISIVVADIQTSYKKFLKKNFYIALKAVVEKVSLRVALMQRLAGLKYSGKSLKF